MRAGSLRHRIRIEKFTDVADEVGQMVRTWSAFARDVPADFDPAKGREHFEANGQVVAEAAEFTIRYREGLVAEWRILFRNKKWDIESVDDVDGRKWQMRIYAATGLTSG